MYFRLSKRLPLLFSFSAVKANILKVQDR